MITKQFLRRFLVTGTVVGASSKAHGTKCDPVCRASELPIYMSEDDCKRREASEELCPHTPGALESTISSIRQQIWDALDRCSLYRRDLEEQIDKGSQYASSAYKYLSEESDDNTKMAAIGGGAVTGFVLGFRGGILRKLLFSGIGAYTMSAVCYPKETAEYSKMVINEVKKYSTITYNFIYGVKKDEISLPKLPKLPSSIGEVWEMAGGLSKSATSLITGDSNTPEIEATIPSKETDTEGAKKNK